MSITRAGGTVIAGRYRLDERIGQGGSGVVWRAQDLRLKRQVAMKELVPPASIEPDERRRLQESVLREARAAARLHHPGAVAVYDVAEDGDRQFIVMELVASPNLADVVGGQGPLDPRQAACIGLELVEVLEAAHRAGLVHRDVKPANVLGVAGGRIRLSDFGIASIIDGPSVTATGVIKGTPSYMAPEQAMGTATGPATDLWSLGATLYFAVEGQSPFDQGQALATLTAIAMQDPRPPERAGLLAPVLQQLLVKDPAARPDHRRLRSLLEPIAHDRPVDGAPAQAGGTPDYSEMPPPAPAAGGRRARRLGARVPFALVGVGAAAVAVVVGVVTVGPLASKHGATAPSASGARPSANSNAVPAGWTPYSDPAAGFKVAYPAGWTVSRHGTLTDFRDPKSGTYLRVDHQSPPAASPDGPWYTLEKSFSASNPGYHRIRIEKADFHGLSAAIWEYTYGYGGNRFHAIDLGMIAGDQGFAFNFQTSDALWAQQQSLLRDLENAFQP